MLETFRSDLARYLSIPGVPESRLKRLRQLAETQGVWAIAVYRFGQWAQQQAPKPLRPLAKAGYLAAFKLTEITTGICLPAAARIGKGLYIGHFGGIFVHPDVTMGEGCSISQGVTLGERGGRRGSPQVGDGVYIGAGAKVLGNVRIGDGAQIGANAVVVHDVPAGATAVGVPARVVERRAHG
jgi:serine O-acetyltransferase